MKVEELELPGLLLVTPARHDDERGWFMEQWERSRYAALGIPGEGEWSQDNVSRSVRGVVRGLHFQHPGAQGKLLTVLHGAILDVVVDVRRGSPTFARTACVPFSAAEPRQLWIPRGFAHGFCATSDEAVVSYKCDARWSAADERTIRWDDPALRIAWPVSPAEAVVSARDAGARRLAEFAREELPSYEEPGERSGERRDGGR